MALRQNEPQKVFFILDDILVLCFAYLMLMFIIVMKMIIMVCKTSKGSGVLGMRRSFFGICSCPDCDFETSAMI